MADVNWSLFDARVLVNGDTSKDRQINNYKNTLTRYKVNSLSYKDIKIDGVSKNLFITDTKDPYVKNLQDVNEVIYSAGTIIQYVDNYWLVEKLSFDGELYKTGNLRYCNYNLKFLSSLLQPISRQCFVTRTRSGTDINGNPVQIELGDGRMLITLAYDSETALLDRTYPDGGNQRLLVDFGSTTPICYQIVNADRVTKPGLVTLDLEECQLSEDDNVELMIAGYDRYEAIPSEVIPAAGKCEIIFNGEPEMQVGLAAKKFVGKFFNSDGDLLEVTPVWNLVIPNITLLDKIITVITDDYITIKVTDRTLIGTPIRLELTDATESVSNFITLNIKSIG